VVKGAINNKTGDYVDYSKKFEDWHKKNKEWKEQDLQKQKEAEKRAREHDQQIQEKVDYLNDAKNIDEFYIRLREVRYGK
jgi:hypothetical protein